MSQQLHLRHGFTTGSAATAAAMAALHTALTGDAGIAKKTLLVPLPKERNVATQGENNSYIATHDPNFLCITIHAARKILSRSTSTKAAWHALACVIKDGGDDPDSTHKAHIIARVRLCKSHKNICITGGKGIGIVTLPGLPIAPGNAAINPTPLKQITSGIQLVAAQYKYEGGVDVEISVPNGEKLAQKTFNPRLGIVGGISILGTQGTVKPFSHDAFKSTIAQGIAIASQLPEKVLCLTTGRRSERFILEKRTEIPLHACVQVADFVKFSIQHSSQYEFKEIIWSCFFGKFIKIAQGHSYTHAKSASIDFIKLMQWCQEGGLHIPSLHKCVTAHHALECILAENNPVATQKILHIVADHAFSAFKKFSAPNVSLHVFHLDGRELLCTNRTFI